MNNLTSYENYFKQIADNYPKIKGFYHVDLFELVSFLNDLRAGKFKTPLLVVESYDTNTSANGNYNIHDIQHGAILIIGCFDIKNLNPEKKTLFLTEMEEITKQVRNKMILDKRSANCSVMKGLIVDSISISRTETIAGNFQGYRMEFVINSENEIELSNDWINV